MTPWESYVVYYFFSNPTPDNSLGVIWPEYTASNRQSVDIGDQLTVGLNGEPEFYQFWKGIFEFAGVEF